MNYAEQDTVFSSDAELRALCVQTGLTAQEVVKRALKTRPDELKLWNHAHTELGKLISIEKREVQYGYQLIVTFERLTPDKYGNSTKENRSIFFNDGGATEMRWNSYMDKRCIFYIGYSKDPNSDGAFRNLLDIEPAS